MVLQQVDERYFQQTAIASHSKWSLAYQKVAQHKSQILWPQRLLKVAFLPSLATLVKDVVLRNIVFGLGDMMNSCGLG